MTTNTDFTYSLDYSLSDIDGIDFSIEKKNKKTGQYQCIDIDTEVLLERHSFEIFDLEDHLDSLIKQANEVSSSSYELIFTDIKVVSSLIHRDDISIGIKEEKSSFYGDLAYITERNQEKLKEIFELLEADFS